jgi:glucokinase
MTLAWKTVLAADVGGTNTKLALGRLEGGKAMLIERKVYSSLAYVSLERVVESFLSEQGVAPYAASVAAACLAVAGPVEHGRARLTNLAWQIEEVAFARHFGFPRVKVINDFAAAGLGIEELSDNDFVTLQAGAAVERANRVVVGAGTGLGVGWLTWNEGGYEVHPSEGGHTDFAPIDALQDELLLYLRRELGRVSYERVLSGLGLRHIFAFVKHRDPRPSTQALVDAMANADPAGAIAAFALDERDPLAVAALDLFVSAYGAFAGNMALMALAHGGIYVAGGIAPKIGPKLEDGTFMRAFAAKGRFKTLLETIPVKVVMNDQVGMLGALAEAARIAGR